MLRYKRDTSSQFVDIVVTIVVCSAVDCYINFRRARGSHLSRRTFSLRSKRQIGFTVGRSSCGNVRAVHRMAERAVNYKNHRLDTAEDNESHSPSTACHHTSAVIAEEHPAASGHFSHKRTHHAWQLR